MDTIIVDTVDLDRLVGIAITTTLDDGRRVRVGLPLRPDKARAVAGQLVAAADKCTKAALDALQKMEADKRKAP